MGVGAHLGVDLFGYGVAQCFKEASLCVYVCRFSVKVFTCLIFDRDICCFKFL